MADSLPISAGLFILRALPPQNSVESGQASPLEGETLWTWLWQTLSDLFTIDLAQANGVELVSPGLFDSPISGQGFGQTTTITYTYDSLSRLKTATYSPGQSY